MNRVDRLMAYLLLFQSRGLMRAQDFANQFEISARTVYRDIQALSEVGVPIAAMPGEGYRLMEGYYLPPITFTPDEARALFLAVSMLDGFTVEGATKTAVTTALDKIRTVLPQRTRIQAEALQAMLRFYSFPAPPINFDNDTFVQLQVAIQENRVVKLHYHAQHNNKITEREVEPLNFVLLDKAWMLSAYCRLRQAPRIFRLDRMNRIRPLAETFTPREIGDQIPTPGELTVVVRFDAEIVRWVRERRHFSFAAEEKQPNGNVIMTFRPRNADQIMGWLLSWGDKLELLSPAEMRTQLAETAVRITQRHQQTDHMPAAAPTFAT
jgi:predicted DNA-binding transcriptional regulator YafY